METKHTPGPWEITPTMEGPWGLKTFEISGDDREKYWIAHVLSDKNDSEEKGEANAKLIAAAPELLNALYRVSALYGSLIEQTSDYNREDNADWRAAQAAIKKATE